MREAHTFLCNGRKIEICSMELHAFSPRLQEECRLLWLQSGRARLLVDGSAAELSGGDLLFINVMSRCACLSAQQGTRLLYVAFDETEFAAAPPQHTAYRVRLDTSKLETRDGAAFAALKELMNKLLAAAREESVSVMIGYGLLLQMIGVLIQDGYAAPLCRDAPVAEYVYYPALMRYLQENFPQPITTERAAKALGISASTVTRIMRRFVGKTLGQYLREIRVNQARWLLTTTQVPLIQISEQCGFQSLASFYRAYRTVLHVTPGSQRRSLSAGMDKE